MDLTSNRIQQVQLSQEKPWGFLIHVIIGIYVLNMICIHVTTCELNHVQLFAIQWAVAYQAPLSMALSRQVQWNERVAILFSRRSSKPRDQIHVSCISCIGRRILYHCTTWESLLSAFIIMIVNCSQGCYWRKKYGHICSASMCYHL